MNDLVLIGFAAHNESVGMPLSPWIDAHHWFGWLLSFLSRLILMLPKTLIRFKIIYINYGRCIDAR